MDIDRVRQQLSDGPPLTSFVHGLGAAGQEEVIIGLTARVRITCEECAYNALQSDLQR
jgi:hypothetical protein